MAVLATDLLIRHRSLADSAFSSPLAASAALPLTLIHNFEMDSSVHLETAFFPPSEVLRGFSAAMHEA